LVETKNIYILQKEKKLVGIRNGTAVNAACEENLLAFHFGHAPVRIAGPRDLNSGPPEYEEAVLTTRPRRSVTTFRRPTMYRIQNVCNKVNNALYVIINIKQFQQVCRYN
jgi:hypothetical protein